MSLEDLKLKIKDEVLISSVIGNYISIKRSGSSQVAVCPFHSDTKPSMNINDSKKIFKCFACGAAGDAISFVMKYRNLDYVSALKDICKYQGINFDAYQEERKTNPKVEMARKILSRASLIYRKIATTSNCLAYKEFIKNRGLNESIATTFALGFAPATNTITNYLNSIPDPKERDFAIAVALELKIIREDKHNSKAQYDTFRDRIMFPIWDQFGQVIGFTSRSIRDDQKPKYLNSMDSFVFNKSNILYGLHLAKNNIREKDAVILVEGNMDLISVNNHGFQNAVAIMGVALGTQSLDRLLGMTKNFYLALDSDNAGYMAMERINKQLGEKGIIAKYIEFSPEKDPDDFLKSQGALAFESKLETASAAYDVILNAHFPSVVPEVLDRKLEILNQVFETLSPLKTELSATERIVTFARRLGLKADATQIIKSYEEYLSKHAEKPKTNYKQEIEVKENSKEQFREFDADQEMDGHYLSEMEAQALYEQSLLEAELPLENHLSKMEKLLLQEIVQLPSLLNMDKFTEVLALVTNDEVKNYIGKIRKIIMEVDDNEYESVVLNLTNNQDYSFDLREVVTSTFFNYRPKESDLKTKQRILFDLKIKLQMEQLKNKKELVKSKQRVCSSQDEMTSLLLELQIIETDIQNLKNTKPQK